MKLRFKKTTADGEVRVETKGEIKEVMISESFLPLGETISLCFRGANSSGIVDLSSSEVEKLTRAVKDKLHLIKRIKRIE